MVSRDRTETRGRCAVARDPVVAVAVAVRAGLSPPPDLCSPLLSPGGALPPSLTRQSCAPTRQVPLGCPSSEGVPRPRVRRLPGAQGVSSWIVATRGRDVPGSQER